MKDVKMISKDTLQSERRVPGYDEMIHIVEPGMNLKASNSEKLDIMASSKSICRSDIVLTDKILKYGSAFDIPQPCFTITENGKPKMMSVREMINKGLFSPRMESNTLPNDWQTMWDALRIDISVRKISKGEMRASFYNIMNMPNSDKIFSVDEFFPYGVVFEENNGEGQAITQGETRLGQYEKIEHTLYAAGFTWTLLAELFDKSFDPQKISDAVLLGYEAKRNDLSLSPIIGGSYSGASATAAHVDTDMKRQELLYNTIVDAIDDLSERSDPVTGRKIMADDLRILANPYDARHIMDVLSGLPSSNERKYPAISGISQVVAYDGDIINMRAKDVEYSGVTQGTCYLVKKNRYMNVGIKRNLTLEVDMRPDVKTLAREERAWYFAEGQQITGITSFVQEITLPTW